MQFDDLEGITKSHSYIDAKIALIASMTFLGVNYGLILLLWFFMVSDTLLGVSSSVTLDGWASVNRRKFLAGIGTKLAILFIPLSLALFGALSGYDLNIFVHTAVYTLIANDAVSCYTHLLSMKTKKKYINKDFVEMLINGLRKAIYILVKNAIDRLAKSNLCDDENEPTSPIKKRAAGKKPEA